MKGDHYFMLANQKAGSMLAPGADCAKKDVAQVDKHNGQ